MMEQQVAQPIVLHNSDWIASWFENFGKDTWKNTLWGLNHIPDA
jgi:hypothetical protein